MHAVPPVNTPYVPPSSDDIQAIARKAIVGTIPAKGQSRNLFELDAFIALLDAVICLDTLKDSRTGFLNDLSRANRYGRAQLLNPDAPPRALSCSRRALTQVKQVIADADKLEKCFTVIRTALSERMLLLHALRRSIGQVKGWQSGLQAVLQRILELYSLSEDQSGAAPATKLPFSTQVNKTSLSFGLLRAAVAAIITYDGHRGLDDKPTSPLQAGQAFQQKEVQRAMQLLGEWPVVPIEGDLALPTVRVLENCATWDQKLETKLTGPKRERYENAKVRGIRSAMP